MRRMEEKYKNKRNKRVETRVLKVTLFPAIAYIR
jgi:hypothetical protein